MQRPVQLEGADVKRTYVDAENGLPLENVLYRKDRGGALREVERERITYLAIDRPARSELSASLFATPVPRGER